MKIRLMLHAPTYEQVDLLRHYGPLPFNLDFYTEMLDLTPLAKCVNSYRIGIFDEDNDELSVVDEERLDRIEAIRAEKESLLSKKRRRISEALAEVLTDFGLISFLPMNIEDGEVSV